MYDDDDDIFSSNDDDILGDKASHRTSKNFTTRGGPSYLRHALDHFISEHPESLQLLYGTFSNGRRVPASVEYFSDITQIFAANFTGSSTLAPYRAMLSLMDEMTNGEVSRRARVYEYERMIAAIHDNVGICDYLYNSITNSPEAPTVNSVEFLGFVVTYMEIQSFALAKIIEEYIEACAQINKQPDELIMNYGIVQTADMPYLSGNGMPVYRDHYKLGDVDALLSLRRKNYENLSEMICKLVFTGAEIPSTVGDSIPHEATT